MSFINVIHVNYLVGRLRNEHRFSREELKEFSEVLLDFCHWAQRESLSTAIENLIVVNARGLNWPPLEDMIGTDEFQKWREFAEGRSILWWVLFIAVAIKPGMDAVSFRELLVSAHLIVRYGGCMPRHVSKTRCALDEIPRYVREFLRFSVESEKSYSVIDLKARIGRVASPGDDNPLLLLALGLNHFNH